MGRIRNGKKESKLPLLLWKERSEPAEKVYLNSCTQELPPTIKITFHFHTDCVWHSEVSVNICAEGFLHKQGCSKRWGGCDLIYRRATKKVLGLCIRSKTIRNVIAVCAACFNEVLGGWTSASGLLITYIYLHVALRWSRMFRRYVRNHTTSSRTSLSSRLHQPLYRLGIFQTGLTNDEEDCILDSN